LSDWCLLWNKRSKNRHSKSITAAGVTKEIVEHEGVEGDCT